MPTTDEFFAQYEATKTEAIQLLGDDFGVINFESLRTSDGLAYTCVILYRGKPVGYIEDDGRGGAVLTRIVGERFYETLFDKVAQEQAGARWKDICSILGGEDAAEIVADALLTKEGY